MPEITCGFNHQLVVYLQNWNARISELRPALIALGVHYKTPLTITLFSLILNKLWRIQTADNAASLPQWLDFSGPLCISGDSPPGVLRFQEAANLHTSKINRETAFLFDF